MHAKSMEDTERDQNQGKEPNNNQKKNAIPLPKPILNIYYSFV